MEGCPPCPPPAPPCHPPSSSVASRASAGGGVDRAGWGSEPPKRAVAGADNSNMSKLLIAMPVECASIAVIAQSGTSVPTAQTSCTNDTKSIVSASLETKIIEIPEKKKAKPKEKKPPSSSSGGAKGAKESASGGLLSTLCYSVFGASALLAVWVAIAFMQSRDNVL